MNKKAIIIMGSSRSDGETARLVSIFNKDLSLPLVDLNDLNISPYDYDCQNIGDDYFPLMERLIEYDCFILATPVYWYTMSAQMKVFLDRLSDCLKSRKDIGRALKGKSLYVLASFGTSLPEGFELPFSQTCQYMGMHYGGCCFHYSGSAPELLKGNKGIADFKKRVLS